VTSVRSTRQQSLASHHGPPVYQEGHFWGPWGVIIIIITRIYVAPSLGRLCWCVCVFVFWKSVYSVIVRKVCIVCATRLCVIHSYICAWYL
jgi:hypothetical protein